MRLVALVLTLALAVPFEADSKPRTIPRIGILWPWSAQLASVRAEAFRQGLREHGYVEGQNIAVESRYAEAPDRLPSLAADLVRLDLDVIATVGTPATLAVKNATATTPIVFVGAGDPVATEVVESLSRPGRNITGLSVMSTELSSKWLELLREAVPGLSRVAVVWNPDNPSGALQLKGTETGARILGIQLRRLPVRDPGDFEPAFSAAAGWRAGGVVVLVDGLTVANAGRVAGLAAKHRLPIITGPRDLVDAGGLMSYWVNSAGLYRSLASYVDRILKGAKPADLPVQQPAQFELVINLKTAKTLGLTIPQSLLVRADEIIQ